MSPGKTPTTICKIIMFSVVKNFLHSRVLIKVVSLLVFASKCLSTNARTLKERKNVKFVSLYSEIRSLDSFQFMSQSLDSLAGTMATSALILLRRKLSQLSEADIQKVRGKGYFPYSF